MNESDEIAFLLKNIRIDHKIDIPTIMMEDPMPIIQRVWAQQAYQSQTEDKKKLLVSRFWKGSDTSLREQCSLAIAGEIVKNDFKYDRSQLPADLNALIDRKIEQIKNHIDSEKMIEQINKESQEQTIAFLSGLNDKSWLRPS